MSCQIPANPDISGVGVRTALYTQNFLSFLPAISALWDDKVTHEELDSNEVLTTTNLVLAFAILISSIVQAQTFGMSSYHASIVLSMSWMNNTNTFVYFLLYVHHKTQPGPGRVKATWGAWLDHVKGKFTSLSKYDTENAEIESLPNQRLSARVLVKRLVLLIGSLHLTLMSALGIWLWVNPNKFGKEDNANECASKFASMTIIGRTVAFNSQVLRICSLVIYAAFLIPGLNLLLPTILFLCIYFWCRRRPSKEANTTRPQQQTRSRHRRQQTNFPQKVLQWCTRVQESWHATLPAFLGLSLLLAINIIFIIDIEVTLSRNNALQTIKNEGNEESQWGFGQILAIILLFQPLRDLAEALLARRLRQKHKELVEDLRSAIQSNELNAVTRALERGASPDKADWARMVSDTQGPSSDILALLFRYLQLNVNLRDGDGGTLLMLLSEHGNEAVNRLRRNPEPGVDLIIPPRLKAFIGTTTDGYLSLLSLLLRHPGTNVNLADKQGKTALMLASRSGRAEAVKLLLLHPKIDVNKGDQDGWTALMLAARHDHSEIVGYLLDRPELDVNESDTNGQTALMWACRSGHMGVVRLLVQRKGISFNEQNRKGHTAIKMAADKGHREIVALLYETPGVDAKVGNAHRSGLIYQVAKEVAYRLRVENLLQDHRKKGLVLEPSLSSPHPEEDDGEVYEDAHDSFQ